MNDKVTARHPGFADYRSPVTGHSSPLVSGTLGAAFGSAPVFWMNAVNLVTISWLWRR